MNMLFLGIGSILASFILLPLVRMISGPTIPDRVVALDAMNTFVVVSMLCFGLGYNSPIYIDVAIVYALLSYVTTLYIAKYLEGSL
ncbi:MAG: cation:proton antiporter [Candidatus Diapherotrites archaeon]|nr:cation:proton antiporter [Candidatus Diapherotrites archaeon]